MTDDDLRRLLVRERRKRGWTQEAVSAALDYSSQSTYAAYETPNGTPPTLKLLRRIAKVYGMELIIEMREPCNG